MNIDSYITLLNRQTENTAQKEQLNEQAIAQAIHGKATNLVAKLSRAIQLEGGILVIVLAIVCIILTFGSHPFLQLIASFSLIICLAMAVIYGWKYRQLQYLVTYEKDTIHLLRGLITAVKQLIDIYSYIIIISTIVGAILGAIYGFTESTASASQMPSILKAWYAIPLSFLLIILLLWATKWYLFKLYGKPLKDLENCLAELQALNPEH